MFHSGLIVDQNRGKGKYPMLKKKNNEPGQEKRQNSCGTRDYHQTGRHK